MRKKVLIALLATASIAIGAGVWLLRRPLSLAADILRTERATPEVIAALQRKRLRALIAVARNHAPYYRDLYKRLPDEIDDLSRLPVVTKPDLMARFDDWVADPAVRQAGVEAFAADPALVGTRYLERYAVWTTSGTTGKPGLFVHDRQALVIYELLLALRGYRWASPRELIRLVMRGRIAAVIATGGHFAIYDLLEHWRLTLTPAQRRRIQILSVLTPLSELVRALNEFQPDLLDGYTSIIRLLAAEQRAGRLRIAPRYVGLGAEELDEAARAEIAAAFHCLTRDTYGATECAYAAFECDHGWLHVNADWFILEPVDSDFSPVSPGQLSYTTLLTNLANHAQPLIRYDLGDSIIVRPTPCPCGSPLPAIQLMGRAGDILRLRTSSGASVAVTPLAIGAVMEETPGVYRAQVIQTAPDALVVRLETIAGADRENAWAEMARRLDAYLTAQGAPDVTFTLSTELPRQEPRGGKFRQVRNEVPRAP